MNSILWGPLLMSWDVSSENQILGWIATALIAGAVLSFPICRKPWSACLAVFGIFAWLLLGMLGWGINV